MSADPDPYEGLLEPQALALRPDDDGRIRLSMAISLMRVADALTPVEISGGQTFEEYSAEVGDYLASRS